MELPCFVAVVVFVAAVGFVDVVDVVGFVDVEQEDNVAVDVVVGSCSIDVDGDDELHVVDACNTDVAGAGVVVVDRRCSLDCRVDGEGNAGADVETCTWHVDCEDVGDFAMCCYLESYSYDEHCDCLSLYQGQPQYYLY